MTGSRHAAGPSSRTLLLLKLFDNFAGFPMDVEVRGIPDAWSELGVPWVDQPTAETPALDSATAVFCGNVYELDVTAYVNAQLADPDVDLGFVLRSVGEGTIGGLRWWQREGDGVNVNTVVGEAPRLLLER